MTQNCARAKMSSSASIVTQKVRSCILSPVSSLWRPHVALPCARSFAVPSDAVASSPLPQLRESVGLSTRTSDADLIAASSRAAELQRDVVVLRKVLATAGRAQLKDAAGEAAGGGAAFFGYVLSQIGCMFAAARRRPQQRATIRTTSRRHLVSRRCSAPPPLRSFRGPLATSAEARAQQATLLVSLAERLAPADAPTSSYDAPSAQFSRAHAYLDSELPTKLVEAYDKVRAPRIHSAARARALSPSSPASSMSW